MPNYDFKCENCEKVQEVFRRFGDKLPEKVSELDIICCKKSARVRQVLHVPHFAVRISHSDIKTIGHLAARNAETMSDDQKLMLDAKTVSKRSGGGKLPEGMSRATSNAKDTAEIIDNMKTEKRARETRKKKNKMTADQKRKFIQDGE